jgi:hypothetical protein
MGVALWATALAVATHAGSTWPVRLALALGALLWLRVTTVEGFHLRGLWPRRVATTSVIAWREPEGTEPPPLRVVFHTALDTFDPGRELVPGWLGTPVIAALLSAQIFADLTVNRNPLGMPRWFWPWAGVLCWCLLVAALSARIVLMVGGRGRPGVVDNRTGLAVLLELARGWPRGTTQRIETRFAATGGRALDRAGLRALVHAIDRDWPARPTLVIDWLAPGIGPGLALLEQGTDHLAETAAADLWIPHHVVHRPGLRREHWPFGRHGPGYIGMVGSAAAAPSPPAVSPEALGRAAQLATEIALRWARKKQVPDVKTV